MMKRFAFILLGLAALAAAAAVAGVLYLRSAGPETEGRVVVAGLADDVEVWRDSLGVPHLWAGGEDDLFFAQGFVHAQDRLWQMELFRRVAEGRLAEVLGPGLLDSDVFLRTIGNWRAAGEQEAVLDPASRRALDAYAAGVNAAIDGWSGALPPEFVALGIRPERWTVRHSLAIEKIMAWDLALYGGAAEATRSALRLDPVVMRALHQDYPPYGPTIIEPPPIPGPAAALLDAASVTRASNAWVIGGSRTVSGKPILANDMHLALRAPSLWHLMALHGGGYDVAGMTLPGVPHVIAGHNRALAWGFTNAMVDDADLFLERVDPSDSTRYLVPGGTAPFRVVEERFRVKGWDSVAVRRIRLTRHGPVLNDVRDPAGRDLIALRWAGHDPSRSFTAFPALNRADGRAAFEAAVAAFDNPHQNVVFADTAGNFGYVMGGRVPARSQGRRPPVLPVPGWTGDWDWAGYLDPGEHPRAFNPPHGYVVTANNRQAAGAAADRISTEWELPFRAIRIRAMILQGGAFDADAVHRMQLDVHDAFAERYRDVAVAAYAAAGLDSAAAALRAWDLAATAESRVAPLFYVWYELLRERTAHDLYDGRGGALPRKSMNLVLDSAALFWRPGGRALLDSLAESAARAALDVASGRSWGELHQAIAEHPLAQAEVLDRFLQLNVGPAPAGGSPTTVNVSHYAGARFPVLGGYGPSQRHVVDMADPDGTGGFILPTGQSGLPFSDHYDDQWPRWLGGGLWRIPLGRDAATARAVHRLVLAPNRQ
jgi:penicillin G amidase